MAQQPPREFSGAPQDQPIRPQAPNSGPKKTPLSIERARRIDAITTLPKDIKIKIGESFIRDHLSEIQDLEKKIKRGEGSLYNMKREIDDRLKEVEDAFDQIIISALEKKQTKKRKIPKLPKTKTQPQKKEGWGDNGWGDKSKQAPKTPQPQTSTNQAAPSQINDSQETSKDIISDLELAQYYLEFKNPVNSGDLIILLKRMQQDITTAPDIIGNAEFMSFANRIREIVKNYAENGNFATDSINREYTTKINQIRSVATLNLNDFYRNTFGVDLDELKDVKNGFNETGEALLDILSSDFYGNTANKLEKLDTANTLIEIQEIGKKYGKAEGLTRGLGKEVTTDDIKRYLEEINHGKLSNTRVEAIKDEIAIILKGEFNKRVKEYKDELAGLGEPGSTTTVEINGIVHDLGTYENKARFLTANIILMEGMVNDIDSKMAYIWGAIKLMISAPGFLATVIPTPNILVDIVLHAIGYIFIGRPLLHLAMRSSGRMSQMVNGNQERAIRIEAIDSRIAELNRLIATDGISEVEKTAHQQELTRLNNERTSLLAEKVRPGPIPNHAELSEAERSEIQRRRIEIRKLIHIFESIGTPDSERRVRALNKLLGSSFLYESIPLGEKFFRIELRYAILGRGYSLSNSLLRNIGNFGSNNLFGVRDYVNMVRGTGRFSRNILTGSLLGTITSDKLTVDEILRVYDTRAVDTVYRRGAFESAQKVIEARAEIDSSYSKDRATTILNEFIAEENARQGIRLRTHFNAIVANIINGATTLVGAQTGIETLTNADYERARGTIESSIEVKEIKEIGESLKKVTKYGEYDPQFDRTQEVETRNRINVLNAELIRDGSSHTLYTHIEAEKVAGGSAFKMDAVVLNYVNTNVMVDPIFAGKTLSDSYAEDKIDKLEKISDIKELKKIETYVNELVEVNPSKRTRLQKLNQFKTMVLNGIANPASNSTNVWIGTKAHAEIIIHKILTTKGSLVTVLKPINPARFATAETAASKYFTGQFEVDAKDISIQKAALETQKINWAKDFKEGEGRGYKQLAAVKMHFVDAGNSVEAAKVSALMDKVIMDGEQIGKDAKTIVEFRNFLKTEFGFTTANFPNYESLRSKFLLHEPSGRLYHLTIAQWTSYNALDKHTSGKKAGEVKEGVLKEFFRREGLRSVAIEVVRRGAK